MLKIGDKKITSTEGEGIELLNDTIIDGNVNINGDIVVPDGKKFSIGGLSSSDITDTNATLILSESMNSLVFTTLNDWSIEDKAVETWVTEYFVSTQKGNTDVWYINTDYQGTKSFQDFDMDNKKYIKYSYTHTLPPMLLTYNLDSVYYLDYPNKEIKIINSFGYDSIVYQESNNEYNSATYYSFSDKITNSYTYQAYIMPLFRPMSSNTQGNWYHTIAIFSLVFDCENGKWYAMLMDCTSSYNYYFLRALDLGKISYEDEIQYGNESPVSGLNSNWFNTNLSDWYFSRKKDNNQSPLETVEHLTHDFTNIINYYPVVGRVTYKDAVDNIKANKKISNTLLYKDDTINLYAGEIPKSSNGIGSGKYGIYITFNAKGRNNAGLTLPNLGRSYLASTSHVFTLKKK